LSEQTFKKNLFFMPTISWDDFEKISIKAGTILSAATLAKARKPAYKLEIDFGPVVGIKKSSAQITTHYQPEELVGRQVVAVVNFPPKQIAGFMSECLVLGVYDENNAVILLQPERPVTNGQPVG
jgi:tRNA-binding protein